MAEVEVVAAAAVVMAFVDIEFVVVVEVMV